MAIILKETQDEDWKTALAKKKEPLRIGTEVKLIGVLENLYGEFIVVQYNETLYNIKPFTVKVNIEEWSQECLTINGQTVSAKTIMNWLCDHNKSRFF